VGGGEGNGTCEPISWVSFQKAADNTKSLAQNKAVNLPAISRVPSTAMTARNAAHGSNDKPLEAQVQEIARITIK